MSYPRRGANPGKNKRKGYIYFPWNTIHIYVYLSLIVLCLTFIYSVESIENYVPKTITNLSVKQIFATNKRMLALLSPTPTAPPLPSKIPTESQGYCLFVPILEYHHIQPTQVAVNRGQTSLSVDPAYFDEQIAYLVNHGYVTISAEQLVQALLHHNPLPQKSIVITIDDGYEDNFAYAFPIAQKYHIIINLMIPTGLLGEQGNNQYFTWGELKQMVSSGLVFITDHTWSHYPLGSGTIEKDQYEILTAKTQLETNLGISINLFTYPYGAGAYNPRVVAELQKDGFIGAFADSGGMYQCDSYIYALQRTHIGNAPLSVYGL